LKNGSAAYQAGTKTGIATALQSEALEAMALEVTMLRAMVATLTEAARLREIQIRNYQRLVQDLAHHIGER
jgi:hypothetical protein